MEYIKMLVERNDQGFIATVNAVFEEIRKHLLSNRKYIAEELCNSFTYRFRLREDLMVVLTTKMIGRGEFLATYYAGEIKVSMNRLLWRKDAADVERLVVLTGNDNDTMDIVQAFKHEITHYLDEKRAQDANHMTKRVMANRRIEGVDARDKAYYNTPHELNSFYISQIERMLTQENTAAMSFTDFKDTFIDKYYLTNGERIWDKLTQRNQRRVVKRLHDMYAKTRPTSDIDTKTRYTPKGGAMRNISNYAVWEKLALGEWEEYARIIAAKYDELPLYDEAKLYHWEALNKSNYILWKRMLSRVEVIFASGDTAYKDNPSTIDVMGKTHPIIYWKGGQPYNTQQAMRLDYVHNKHLYISIDYSEHPVFSLVDNIVFRAVHDFIVHIQGDYPFGLKGELQSYNLHAKLAPDDAIPALFTEVVGQVCQVHVNGDFPTQKVALIDGVDYINIGVVDGYEVTQKKLRNINRYDQHTAQKSGGKS
jgi:hypothetical protein